MTFHTTTGATGTQHLSKAEAAASYRLLELGIVPDESFFPCTFLDKDGATFKAKGDFCHTVSSVRFEFKAGALNGLSSVEKANKARARFDTSEAQGYITPYNRAKQLLDCSWSNSAQKIALVQQQAPVLTVLVFDTEPSEKDQKRLAKTGTFWRTMKQMSVLAFFLKLSSQGLAVSFSTDTHAIRYV